MPGFSMEDYVDVATRIAIFRDKHPNGSLQSELVQYGPDVVIVKAYAYRTPDDARPGMGYATCPLPGTTPYTRGSEVMNAETSAWGRAIVAALAADTKQGVASKDEVVVASANTNGTNGNGHKKSGGTARSNQRAASGEEPAGPARGGGAAQPPAPVAVIDPDKATPQQWAQLLRKYGSNAAVVKKARELFEDAVRVQTDITVLQAERLLEG